MEAAGELVIDAAARHGQQRMLGNFAETRFAPFPGKARAADQSTCECGNFGARPNRVLRVTERKRTIRHLRDNRGIKLIPGTLKHLCLRTACFFPRP